MGDLICRACHRPVVPGGLICPGCRANLTAPDAVVDAAAPDPTALLAPDHGDGRVGHGRVGHDSGAADHNGGWVGHDGGPADHDGGRSADPTCPRCDADLPTADIPVCPACLSPLAGGLVLRLDGGVDVRWRQVVLPGTELVLGRDPRESPAAQVLARYDTVSRRHARVTVDRRRHATVTDLGSTNGTFVDDTAVPPGTTVDLPAGARLRLGRSVSLVVGPA
ncbi:FHA domain-containing protein [Micromonospora sp. WMMD882]|uniref:FHA domain-containing protein n=1 Tax=Micromonospora sp. WMMD882 TaxID=3015151 RepID=UPI00248BF6F9|nr:FHA domain-containing protein [Micromonospora sp. WMMD882]WBB80614.1 FHA domain-containing protein [Micromonospora sp. WMMD882]